MNKVLNLLILIVLQSRNASKGLETQLYKQCI